jgi:hypothetical protein
MDTFTSKVDKTDTCWNWIAATTKTGYGQIFYKGKNWKAHRLSYTLTKGEIPEGLVLDHLCRNRLCVNPDHLEPVTLAENIRRGRAGLENNHQTKKNNCPNGHPYSGVDSRGKRICHKCRAEAQKRYVS